MEQSLGAVSTQLLRRINAGRVVQFAWDTGAFTASDAIVASGLTRSTVLRVCDELIVKGWIHELSDTREAGAYSKGRPARRYAFRSSAAHVVAVDAGQHHVSAWVTDLQGSVLASSPEPITPRSDSALDRRRAVERAVNLAVDGAGASERSVLAAVIGVPAPTDENGVSPRGDDGFWARMNPGFAQLFGQRGWSVVIENDANLAAIAEGAIGAGVGVSSFVNLLSGARFGAGVMANGALVRGARGGVGELHLLDLVDGVGSADGLGRLAVAWTDAARVKGTIPITSPLAAGQVEALDVFAAARAGDATAVGIVDRLAARLARVCAVLGGLLDTERIIIGGAIAPAADLLIERAEPILAAFMHGQVPTLVASPLGARAVGLGAIHRGLELIRSDPLRFSLNT
jgi:predicted NBD/HSP70 family sugar kinase